MAFKKGQSGNPKGKKKGTKNKTTLAREALVNKCITEKDLRAMWAKMVELALDGSESAARLCFEYRLGKPAQAVAVATMSREDAYKQLSSMFGLGDDDES